MMDIWKKVKEKLATEGFNPHIMYEQTHNPVAAQDSGLPKEYHGKKSKLEVVKDIYKKKYKKRQARKNLV